jgi:hypothetical protein
MQMLECPVPTGKRVGTASIVFITKPGGDPIPGLVSIVVEHPSATVEEQKRAVNRRVNGLVDTLIKSGQLEPHEENVDLRVAPAGT